MADDDIAAIVSIHFSRLIIVGELESLESDM
jgi:hypothetical protein